MPYCSEQQMITSQLPFTFSRFLFDIGTYVEDRRANQNSLHCEEHV